MNLDRRKFSALLSEFAKLNERLGKYLAMNESDSDRKVKTEEEIVTVLNQLEHIADLYIK